MIKNKKLYKLLDYFLLSLLMLCNIAIAKENSDNDYYQVEMIIFKNNNDSDLSQESWPLTELTIPSNSIRISNSENSSDTSSIAELANHKFNFEKSDNKVVTNKFYKLLTKSDLEYRNVSDKIKANQRYTLISHIGWRLPKVNATVARPIYFETGHKHKISSNNTDSSSSEISGLLRFEQKKFLHSDLEILLNLPANITNKNNMPFELIKNNNKNGNDFLQSFRISEARRLKYKELNYFDHPAFGMIIVIS